jgi:hypothetical protein
MTLTKSIKYGYYWTSASDTAHTKIILKLMVVTKKVHFMSTSFVFFRTGLLFVLGSDKNSEDASK